MRIRFFVPDDEQETEQYLGLIKQIDEFWREFTKHAARLDVGAAERVGADLRAWLGRIDSGLGLELSVALDGTRHCLILPVLGEHLLPLAELFVERAPERVPWLFGTRRERLPLAQCLDIVRRDCGKDLSSARARVGVGRGHALEVVVGSEHFDAADDDAALDAANCLVSRLMGDELFDSWVQQVSVVPQPKPSPLSLVGQQSARLPLALDELYPALTAAVQGIVRGLPELACHSHCERADWVMFELGGQRSPSSTASTNTELSNTEPLALQLATPADDLLVAATMCPEMLRCYLSQELFDSQRFSRFGEVFCYLKLELAEADQERRVTERIQLEQVLDRALVPGRLGCVAGSGSGSTHVYIVLALVQLEAATQLVIKKAREAGVGTNSWLLYCDSVWRNEWTGIWPETPPPFSNASVD